ncbi:MAG TPA: AAC(3) family N-acetyltransferase [Gemmatimonadales bacterium]|nr:AAC(3) family N-acetyltransferase [Gemmatimonadales bacterium]
MWLVPDLAHQRRADRDRQDDRAHRHVPRPLREARDEPAGCRGGRVRDDRSISPTGPTAPWLACTTSTAFILLLGVGHDANTTVDLAEYLAGVRYRRPTRTRQPFCTRMALTPNATRRGIAWRRSPEPALRGARSPLARAARTLCPLQRAPPWVRAPGTGLSVRLRPRGCPI